MAHDPFLNQSQDRAGPAMPSLKEGQWLFNRRYELLRKLGAGGMGVVWLARDHTEHTEVALKFLPTVLVQHEGEMKRLRDEVRAGKELRHPGIVATYALELEDSTAAIVMEYVEGKTLAELLEAQERGFFEREEIASWMGNVAAAVDYLHWEAKRIHRDIKPANILVDAQGRARLMDFGISRRVQESVTRHSKTSEGHGDSSATLAYASPQQLGGKPAHPADDLYSFGAMLYELLTGTPPFFRGDAALVAVQIATQAVTPVMERRAELVAEGVNAGTGLIVPDITAKMVLACLAKEREQRPANARIVCEALVAQDPPPMPVRSPSQVTPPAKPVPKPTSRVHSPSKTTVKPPPGPSRHGGRLSGPFWAVAVFVIVCAGAWAILSKPKEVIKEMPKLVEDTTAKEEAARQKQRADDLEKKAKDEEQKRLAAEAATAKAKEDADKMRLAKEKSDAEEKQRQMAAAAEAARQAADANAPANATKDKPFTNSLGMKFVPVPINAGPSKGQRILFSVWETRSKDYAAFVKDSGHDAGEDWRTYSYNDDLHLPVGRGEGETAEESSHPVANVSHDDAVAFCAWLTKKDRASGQIGPQDDYRLPSDVEWSYAVGIGDQEDANASPKDKNNGSLGGVYPWGTMWGTTSPPPARSGNYADMTAKAKGTIIVNPIASYVDGYATTAPVGSFLANGLGLFDLGGNLGEWTGTVYDPGDMVVRGASWYSNLLSAHSSVRGHNNASSRIHTVGFRCVLVVSGGAVSSPSATSPAPPATPATASASSSPLDSGAVGKQHEVTLPGGVKLALCFCPAGSFTMGSPVTEEGHEEWEEQVQVTLTQPFWLARTELTQAQWRALMGTDPSHFKGDDLPVEMVSAEDADACIVKLNEKVPLTGWKWALPTEAQWEYACRAGTTTPFHFGSVLSGKEANCDGRLLYGTSPKGPYLEKTVAVDSYAANAWGLCDMHGNVDEWCRDLWDGSTKLPGGTNPLGASGFYRVHRGGTWFQSAWYCRAACRLRDLAFTSCHNLGFRPAAVPASGGQ